MTAAYTLLVLALQLLTLVSTTPNVTPELRAQAVSVANTAIAAANAEIAQPKQVAQSTYVTPAPVLGATMSAPMADESRVTAEVVQVSPADPVNGVPHGTYFIRVRVYDANGTTVSGASVAMSAPGENRAKTIDTRETPESSDYFTTFAYTPQSAGDVSITFTSGSLSTSLPISIK